MIFYLILKTLIKLFKLLIVYNDCMLYELEANPGSKVNARGYNKSILTKRWARIEYVW